MDEIHEFSLKDGFIEIELELVIIQLYGRSQ